LGNIDDIAHLFLFLRGSDTSAAVAQGSEALVLCVSVSVKNTPQKDRTAIKEINDPIID
jgi:hypothetical protein